MPTKIIAEKEIEYPTEDTVEIEEVFNVCIFPDEPAVDLEAWKKYLNDSLILDDASLDTIPSGSYTVIVKFAVGEKGRLSKISILKDPGHGLGERVTKLLLNCEGIWRPVIDKGGYINSYRIQPITFTVEEECEELPANFIL
jgi:hypothetical protein